MAKDAILNGNAVKISLSVVLLSHGFQQYNIALTGVCQDDDKGKHNLDWRNLDPCRCWFLLI